MNTSTRNYANGTSLTTRMPWGINIAGKAMCADGKVRKVCRIAPTADTFFSIPAAVRVNGKTVSGYVTLSTASGRSIETPDDPAYLEFRAVESGKNYLVLPNVPIRIGYYSHDTPHHHRLSPLPSLPRRIHRPPHVP